MAFIITKIIIATLLLHYTQKVYLSNLLKFQFNLLQTNVLQNKFFSNSNKVSTNAKCNFANAEYFNNFLICFVSFRIFVLADGHGGHP